MGANMKKSFLYLTVSLLLIGSSFSQVKISGGILGGLNLANVTVDPDPGNLNTLTGFGAGGVLNFEFAGGFCIQAEPMYLQAGTKTSITEQGITVDVKLKADYISIPVLFMYVFQTGENQVQPFIFAGPSLGFLMSAKMSAEATSGGVSAGTDVDVKDSLKTTDFGAIFGAGVNIPAGGNTIFLEGRYSLGLSDINNSPATFGTGTTIKTKGIQFFAGIRFPFGS
jgi:hypothetical protein